VRHCACVLILFWLAGCGKSPAPKQETPAPAKSIRAVKISHFYAARAEVLPGEPVLLCYGVENAVTVRIEPPVEQLKPRYNRCFQVSPRHTTTYRLVAEGDAGSKVSGTVTVQVRTAPEPEAPPEELPSLITLFLASTAETSAGRPVTLC
jgi:hypothetical protein